MPNLPFVGTPQTQFDGGGSAISNGLLPRRLCGAAASLVRQFRHTPEQIAPLLSGLVAEAEAETPNHTDEEKAAARRALLNSIDDRLDHPLHACVRYAMEARVVERGLAARLAIAPPEEHAAISEQFAGWLAEHTEMLGPFTLYSRDFVRADEQHGGLLMPPASTVFASVAHQLIAWGSTVRADASGGIVFDAVLAQDVALVSALLSTEGIRPKEDINAKGLPPMPLHLERYYCLLFALDKGYRATLTPLEVACLNGDDAIVECLLDAGACVDGFTFAFAGGLTTAATVSRLLALLQQTTPPKSSNEQQQDEGTTKKYSGAAFCDGGTAADGAEEEELFTVLNTTDRYGRTALHYACRGGNTHVIRFLISHPQIKVRSAGAGGAASLLWEAIVGGCPSVLNVLMEFGATTIADLLVPIPHQKFTSYSPFSAAVSRKNAFGVNSPPAEDCSSLHVLAAYFGALSPVALTVGPRLPSRAPLGAFACVLQIFLDAGADINARDADGATPLFYCSSAEAAMALLAVPGCDADARIVAPITAAASPHQKRPSLAPSPLSSWVGVEKKRGDVGGCSMGRRVEADPSPIVTACNEDFPPKYLGRTVIDFWMLGDGNILFLPTCADDEQAAGKAEAGTTSPPRLPSAMRIRTARAADDPMRAFVAILGKMSDPAGALCRPVSRGGGVEGLPATTTAAAAAETTVLPWWEQSASAASGPTPSCPPSSLIYELVLSLPALADDTADATRELQAGNDHHHHVTKNTATDGSSFSSATSAIAPAAIRLLLAHGVCPSASVGPMPVVKPAWRVPHYLKAKEKAAASAALWRSATVSAFFLATCIGRGSEGMVGGCRESTALNNASRDKLFGIHAPTVTAMAAAGGAAKEPAVWLRYQLQRAIADMDAQRLEGLLRGACPALLAQRLPTREEEPPKRNYMYPHRAPKCLEGDPCTHRTPLKEKMIRVVDDALLFCLQFTISQAAARRRINSNAANAAAEVSLLHSSPPTDDNCQPQHVQQSQSPKYIPSDSALVAAQRSLLRLLLAVVKADPNADTSFPEPLLALLFSFRGTLSIRTLRILIDEGGMAVNGVKSSNGPLHSKAKEDNMPTVESETSAANCSSASSKAPAAYATHSCYQYVTKAIEMRRPDIARMLWVRGCANGGNEDKVLPRLAVIAATYDINEQRRMRMGRRIIRRGQYRYASSTPTQAATTTTKVRASVRFPRSFVAKSRAFVSVVDVVSHTIGELRGEAQLHRRGDAASAVQHDTMPKNTNVTGDTVEGKCLSTCPTAGPHAAAPHPQQQSQLRLRLALDGCGWESPAVNIAMVRNGIDVNATASAVAEITVPYPCAQKKRQPPTTSLVHKLCYLERYMYSRLACRQRYPTLRAAIEAGAEVNYSAAAASSSLTQSHPPPPPPFGATPLMTAVLMGWSDAVWLLIENGADRSATDANGRRAIDFLRGDDYEEDEDWGPPASKWCDDALRIALDPSHIPTDEESAMIVELRLAREARLAKSAAALSTLMSGVPLRPRRVATCTTRKGSDGGCGNWSGNWSDASSLVANSPRPSTTDGDDDEDHSEATSDAADDPLGSLADSQEVNDSDLDELLETSMNEQMAHAMGYEYEWYGRNW